MDREHSRKESWSNLPDLAVFDKLDYKTWKELVEADLKGVPFDKKLLSGTLEGIVIEPLYAKDIFSQRAADISAYLQELSGQKGGLARWELLQEFPPRWPANASLNLIPYVEAGASAVQELGIGLAILIEHLRNLENEAAVLKHPEKGFCWFSAAGPDFFMEIAKFRAIRVLFGLVMEECGLEKGVIYIAARTAYWNKTRLDPYVNMLRSSSEALSIVLGVCDALYVSAFDEIYEKPSTFSRRIADNVGILLMEESHLDVVRDAGGGSFYIETFCAQLCEKAWSFFQEIEKKGGLSAAESDALIRSELLKSVTERKKLVARRKQVLVGTSMYVNQREEINLNKLRQVDEPGGLSAGSLEPYHAALDYENLRLAAWNFKKENGHAPRVFLMNMGGLQQYKARADFCRDFLEPGGFEVIYPEGFETAQAAVKAAAESGAGIFVLCSNDESYPELVPTIVPLIKKEAPNASLVVAGLMESHVDAFKALGVRAFIHIRANNLEMLQLFQAMMGVQK